MEVADLTKRAISSSDQKRQLAFHGLPRLVEVLVAALGLFLTAPALLVIAVCIAFESDGPIIFKQQRQGKGGRRFVLYKFRTMICGTSGPEVTSSCDKRITRVGTFLRQTKLDELPELWNVLRGEMSLVGPRPEVARYTAPSDPAWQQVLRVRPGLTHPVTLKLRDEEKLLAMLHGDPEQAYKEVLVPYKLKGYIAYESERSWWQDVKVIWQTAFVLVSRTKTGRVTLEMILEKSQSRGPQENENVEFR